MKVLRFSSILLCIVLLMSVCLSCTDMSNRNPVVTFVLDESKTSGMGGTFVMELFPDKAPNSVNYVLALIDEGYYDNFFVSKVIYDSMVVFGDPWYAKKNDRVIDGEFKANGFDGNDISFTRGIVGLSLDEGDNNSNYGDFFIVLDDNAADSLNGNYCAIGRITEGLELIDEISRIDTSSYLKYQPYVSVATKTVTVDLKGRMYDQPVVHERKKESKPGYWD